MKRSDCIFRVDAGPGTGLGHLSRCLTLAEALQKKGMRSIAFVTRTPAEVKKKCRIFRVITIPGTNEPAFWKKCFSKQPPGLVVIDSYKISTGTLKRLKKILPFIAFIDDFHHLSDYPVDAVINYNITAPKIKYKCPPSTRLFLGLKYALIRSDVKRGMTRSGGRETRLYVSLGGSPDPLLLKKLAAALRPLGKGLRVDMAAGLSDNRLNLRQKFIRLVPGPRAAASMARCDAAISASGVTGYELGYLGIPSMITVIAKNQEAIAAEMARRGFFISLGWLKKISTRALTKKIEGFLADAGKRRCMAQKTMKAIDGKGSQRLAAALIKLRKEKK